MDFADLEQLLAGRTWKMVARWRDAQATQRIADQPADREAAMEWGSLPPEAYQLAPEGVLLMQVKGQFAEVGTWQINPSALPAAFAQLVLSYQRGSYPVVRKYEVLSAEPQRVYTFPLVNDGGPPIYCEFAPIKNDIPAA